jgi:hypothetical protein
VVAVFRTQRSHSGLLRSDGNQPVREGMLDLLCDAFTFGWRVHFDHEVSTGKAKGTIVRVWVTKDKPAPVPGGGVVVGPIGPLTPSAPPAKGGAGRPPVPSPGVVFGVVGSPQPLTLHASRAH